MSEAPAATETRTYFVTIMGGGSVGFRDESGEYQHFRGGPHEINEAAYRYLKAKSKRQSRIRVGTKPVRHDRDPKPGMFTTDDLGLAAKGSGGRAADRVVKEKAALDPGRPLGVSYPCPVEGCADADGGPTEYVTQAALDRHIEKNHKGDEDGTEK